MYICGTAAKVQLENSKACGQMWQLIKKRNQINRRKVFARAIKVCIEFINHKKKTCPELVKFSLAT